MPHLYANSHARNFIDGAILPTNYSRMTSNSALATPFATLRKYPLIWLLHFIAMLFWIGAFFHTLDPLARVTLLPLMVSMLSWLGYHARINSRQSIPSK